MAVHPGLGGCHPCGRRPSRAPAASVAARTRRGQARMDEREYRHDRARAEELLELATGIAEEAGQMLLAKRPARPEVLATKSSPTDVVTALDRAAEELIRARIAETRPHD